MAEEIGEPEEEFPSQRAIEEASFNTIQPAPNDVADEWLLREFTEEEVERQRQYLEDLERRRASEQHQLRQRATVQRTSNTGRRIPPPPPPPEYYILDPSNEDEKDALYAPGLSGWHGGDNGATRAGPPAMAQTTTATTATTARRSTASWVSTRSA